MADDNFKAKSLKRKNVKGLKLGGGGDSGHSTPAPAPVVAAADPYDMLSDQLSTLEIGVEFKLDLRAEDLKVVNELGAGNGGTVSKVIHVATRTLMARKVIHVDAKPAVRKQIVRELHIMHECHSPYIVAFYGAFLNEGDVVMCMEYMDCGSLDAIAKKIGPIRIDVLGKISEAVVEGLHYLYSVHRILHRDVKPSNILVNSRGSIKLCDFGVSGELVNSIADTFVGTSTYMSPERIKGAQYSVKSDIWSLGLTLLELAIGRFPFDSDGTSAGTRASAGPMGILDLLQKIVNEPAPRLPRNPAFPLSLETMIDHCLIKDPDKRPSPQELLTEPFMRSAKATNVDLEGWAHEVLEKITGKPHHRSRSSVSSQVLLNHQREIREAPPRPISRDSPALGGPPRRPSAASIVSQEGRRPSASAEARERGGTPHPPNPFPTRSSSHTPAQHSLSQSQTHSSPSPRLGSSANHDRSESSASRASSRGEGGMMPPPPPAASPRPPGAAAAPRPPMQKSYTESAATPVIESAREREKLEREREADARRERAYRQGSIGIGFEGGLAAPVGDVPRSERSRERLRDGDERREVMPEMVERRRPPPMVTMSSSGNGVGVTNGSMGAEWGRRRE